jgi:hypothetical protein
MHRGKYYSICIRIQQIIEIEIMTRHIKNPRHCSGNIPKTPQIYKQEKGAMGQTLLHKVSTESEISETLKGNITPRMFMEKDDFGNSPMHYIALRGLITYIPKRFLTAEVLSQPGQGGATPLHHLSMKCAINKIPKALINISTMTLRDEDGNTILHNLASMKELRQVGNRKLTPALLKQRNNKGISVLDLVLREAFIDSNCPNEFDSEGQLKLSLKLLNLRDLKGLNYRQGNKTMDNHIKEEIKNKISQRLTVNKNELSI